MRDRWTYFLGATSDLLEKEDVDRLELRQVGLALNAEEVVDVFFEAIISRISLTLTFSRRGGC